LTGARGPSWPAGAARRREGLTRIIHQLSTESSSGNVFADLGVDAPNEMLAKAKLASVILDVIERRKPTQHKAAKILGTDQAYISK